MHAQASSARFTQILSMMVAALLCKCELALTGRGVAGDGGIQHVVRTVTRNHSKSDAYPIKALPAPREKPGDIAFLFIHCQHNLVELFFSLFSAEALYSVRLHCIDL